MAILLTSYYRPKPGGCCKRLIRAINALLADGHTVHYLAIERFPIDHRECHFHRFPWPRTAAETLAFWAAFHLLAPFWILFIGLRQGVTHTFAFQHTYALIMQPLRLFKSLPLTLFLRSDVIECHLIKGKGRSLSRLLAAVDGVFEALAFKNARLVFCSHALQAQVMSRHLGSRPASIAVLPNDIPAADVERRKETATPIRMSFIGTLEPRKNPDILLHIIANLPDDKATLAFFGIGPEAERLKALSKALGLQEKAVFRGWVPAEEAWAETDLLLFPSMHEGSPNVVLEAIAHGVPVLAGDIAEMAEMIPAAYLLPVDNAVPWAEAINDILEAPRMRLESVAAEQGAFAAHLKFDWDAAVREQILGETPPQTSGPRKPASQSPLSDAHS